MVEDKVTGKRMIAHINASGKIQTVKSHSEGTACLTQQFAEEFGCGKQGYFCGLLHDIGKYSEAFQRRIADPEHTAKVDHSTAGAVEAMKIAKENIPLAMTIAGHHSGLLNGGVYRISNKGDGTFFGRIKGAESLPDYAAWKRDIVPEDVNIPAFCRGGSNPCFTMSFFIRMMYSCLVDADYLDTEAFMKENQAVRGEYDSLKVLAERFDNHIKQWLEKTDFKSDKQKILCSIRNQVLQDCMSKGSELPPGIYTLTVPTGGGKTTASLGFALRHAIQSKMKRIIYVIPYTSIIDQNAEVFRSILGEKNVLEHHSGILYDLTEDKAENEAAYRKALATENWDMPVIVTTAVQFFESLYANRSSKCRKLHNMANSVIIFDEAQTMPIPYLEPCVAAIAELAAHYRSTIVLCTATQPVLDEMIQKYMPQTQVREICEHTDILFQKLRRTSIVAAGNMEREKLIDCLTAQEQVLCIVNSRNLAQELFEEIPREGAFCLTTLLHPEHRKEKLREIKERLEHHVPCRVIATSLVEAGVDLDFPCVYRQENGLDALIQAAGRCNREGTHSPEESKVYLFGLKGDASVYFAQNISALRQTLRCYEDPTAPEAIAFYFKQYREILGRENLDQKKIMDAFTAGKGINGDCFPFATVAREFHLIESETQTVYIPVGEAELWIEEMEKGKVSRKLMRKLGQYAVNVYPNHLKALYDAGCVEGIGEGMYVLRDMNQYHEDTGLQMDVSTGYGLFG